MKKIVIFFVVLFLSATKILFAQSDEPYLVKRFDKKPEIVDGIQFGEYAYFKAETKTKTGQCIYITSGDSNSTYIVDSSSAFAEFFNFEIYNENLYYGCKKNTGCYLIKVSKTSSKIDSIATTAIPCFLTSFNDKLYYVGVNPNSMFTNMALFEYDDKTQKSKLLFSSKRITMGARIQKLLVFDNKLFFVSSDTIVNSNLWQDKLYCFSPIKDSIIQLTKNKDYLSCGNQNQNLSYFTIFNNQLYFNSYDSLKGFEMFVTDGTLDGTHLFKDINDSYSCDGGPRFGATNFCKYEDYLFFLGYDSLNGTQLWNTDGINTKLVKEINPNYYNRPYRDQDFIAMLVGKNCLFINYIQQDSLLVGNCGLYIFKKDSICQINFSKDSYHSRFNEYIFIHHDKLYFYRGVDGNNFNLWVTDGTDDGTHIVLAANTKNSLPISFTSLSYNAQHDNRFFSYNGSLYFEANYDSIGFGLYRLDDFDAPVKKVDSTLIEQMLCYPNPTKEILNIKFTTLATESCNLSLTDMYGRIIYTENFTSDASTNTKQINISKFAIGTYVVHLSYPNKSLKTKVEVHK